MRTYRVLTTLSTADGTHIHPGSVIGLLSDDRAAALIAAEAITPDAPDAPVTPEPAEAGPVVAEPAGKPAPKK